MSNSLIELLPWDSSHFGVRVAHAIRRQVDKKTCSDLLRRCREEDIDCLYFLADAAEQDTIAALQTNRFDFVDIRLTLTARHEAPPEAGSLDSVRFRLGDQRDLDQLYAGSRCEFSASRASMWIGALDMTRRRVCFKSGWKTASPRILTLR